MIDIDNYRSRIGLFKPKPLSLKNKFLYKNEYYKKSCWNENQAGSKTLFLIPVFKFVLLLGLLLHYDSVQTDRYIGCITLRSRAGQAVLVYVVQCGGHGLLVGCGGEQDTRSVQILHF